MKISICIPVVRVEQSLECIEAIHENSGLPKEQYEIVTAIDYEKIGCPRMLKKLVGRSKHDLICFLGDDTRPQKDFLKIALDYMGKLPDGWGVVGLNSGGNDHAHWLADRRILEHIPGGCFFSIEFEHCFGDDELKDIAMELDRWVYAEDAIIDHKHPIFGTAPVDEHYQAAYNGGRFERDKRTYRLRKIDRHMATTGPMVGIGLPLTDLKVYTHFMFSFLKMDKPHRCGIYMPNYPGNLDAVRNDLVQQAFIDSCTHLIMMDTDQIYLTQDTILRMLNHNKPVVGARVHKRYPPFDPLLYRGDVNQYYAVPDDEIEAAMKNGNPLVEVAATGCGCIMYDMRVFADIPEPWFSFDRNPETGAAIGEDIGFCIKLKAAGYKIYVDCGIEIQHLTLHATDWKTYKLFSKLHGYQKPQQQQTKEKDDGA